MKMIVAPLLRIFFRPWMEGAENIPDEGAAIIASNHLSFSDSFFLPALMKRRVTFIAKAEYFNTPGLKGKLTAAFFKGVGQLPVDRSGVRGAGEAAIRSAISVIDRGELFGVYPEGTRSPDGKLYRGKVGGLARVALATGAPVIPVAMIDTEKVQPPGQVLPTFGIRPGIRIGRPLDFSRYQGMENDRFILRSVTDEVMYEIMRLSGQEYVDIYATAAKRQIADDKKRADAERRAEQRALHAEQKAALKAQQEAEQAQRNADAKSEEQAKKQEPGNS
ncbi:1-acyl-sn-glycerol-3-phosphate acyltransferase [Kitasatospora sp. MAA4]|uniref:1-acyl-sn-glycerol-3-phosphate acyltransferase n=1 Tax=Kitasatospora sp. MAA4 TaxID=3035093 RepID=UPI002474755F|nr:1-acyl-sn-glycerol-3-phosphate acyltransferase [Kitasatospora sp. MAA4]